MLSNKIGRIRAALGELAGQVDAEQWAFISACRRDLEGAEQYAHDLEMALAPLAASYIQSKLGKMVETLGGLRRGEVSSTHH